MKKLLSFAAVCLFVAVMCSCGGSKTPEDVAKKAIECIIDKDYEGYVDMMYFKEEKTDEEKAQLTALIVDKMNKEMEKKEGIKDFQVGTAEIEENSAIVPYTINYGNGDKKEDAMKLIKDEDGDWKIDSGK
jgi:hypothetical protein